MVIFITTVLLLKNNNKYITIMVTGTVGISIGQRVYQLNTKP